MPQTTIDAVAHPRNASRPDKPKRQRAETPQAALDRLLVSRLSSIHFLLSWILAFLALGYAVLLPTEVALPNLAVGCLSSAGFAIAWALRRKLKARLGQAHQAAATTLGILTINCLVYGHTTGDPEATHGFIFVLLGAALTLNAPRWMVGSTVAIVASWCSLASVHWSMAEWFSPALNLMAGAFVALSGQLGRSHTLREREENRYKAEKNATALAATLTQAKQEIRSRRTAEASLRRGEARKSAILDAALDAIVTLDREGRILDFNPCAEQMFGAARANVEGMKFSEFFVPFEMRAAHDAGLARFVDRRTGEIVNQRLELEATRADGERFPVELTVSPIEVGGDIEFTAYLRDLTEIRRTQQALESAAREQGRVAREIQEHLLVGEIPTCEGLEIASSFIACHDVGGDFLDFSRTPNGLDVMVGDVMGKGVPAALVGAVVKASFATQRMASGPGSMPVSQLVTRVDREHGPELYEIDRFITLAYARFDLSEGTLRFVDCGHTKTVRGHPEQDVEFLIGSNPPMGIVLNDEIVEHAIALRHGDVYVFYSDGLIEAENEAGDQFGQERVGDVVLEHISDPVDTILSALDKRVRDFMAADGFDDDFTVAVVRVL